LLQWLRCTTRGAARLGSHTPRSSARGAFLCAPSTINGTAFQLFKKGSIKKLAAAVSYSASTDTAKLDPTGSLQGGATYKAVVSTGAKDLAGNPLDQNNTTTGLQQMACYFTVRR
jgi:hypothetical protein